MTRWMISMCFSVVLVATGIVFFVSGASQQGLTSFQTVALMWVITIDTWGIGLAIIGKARHTANVTNSIPAYLSASFFIVLAIVFTLYSTRVFDVFRWLGDSPSW